LLKVKDLNLVYENKNHVLKDINFEVKNGEIFGIIGLSGAGKSSLLRTLNLLQRPTSGNIFLDEIDITTVDKKDLRNLRKKISIVFQHFNLLSTRNVFDNIALPLEIEKKDIKEIEKKVDKILEEVNLSHKKNSYPSQLSGGEKQRTAIARGMINNPEILLLDEPTSALDPQTTQKILDLILDINKRFNLSIIIVTHEMDVIKKICDKVVYLKNGSVEFFGPVHELFVEKENEIFKEFYQEINIDWSRAKQLSSKETIKLLKIVFWGKHTHEAVLDEVSKKYDVKVNILYGKIEHLKDNPYGTLIINVESENGKINDFIKELDSKVYSLEVLQ
jgi:D-methionine transport system ATP-binding protein